MAHDLRRRRPPGIGFVETLVVLLVFSLLAGIAYPQIQGVRTQTAALAAARDVDAITAAAAAYRRDSGAWPPDIGTMDGPGPLRPYLPATFLFLRPEYQIAWEHWTFPNGLPPGSDSTSVTAVTFRSSNRNLAMEIDRALGGRARWFTVGDRATFILDGLRPPDS